MAKEFFVWTMPATNDTEDARKGEERNFEHFGFASLLSERGGVGEWEIEVGSLRDNNSLGIKRTILDSDTAWLASDEVPNCTMAMRDVHFEHFKIWCAYSGVVIVGERDIGHKNVISSREFLARLRRMT